jgi:hypothetical protein
LNDPHTQHHAAVRPVSLALASSISLVVLAGVASTIVFAAMSSHFALR